MQQLRLLFRVVWYINEPWFLFAACGEKKSKKKFFG